MNKDYLIKLTQRLYRLTFLFPKKEPLRYKMREFGDEILADITGPKFKEEAIEKLEVLDSFFEVTKTQNWVAFNEILNLQEEYTKLKTDLLALSVEETQVKNLSETPVSLLETAPTNSLPVINDRQKKILEILKEKEKTQVWEVKQVFPEISKRTLRRDFERLLKQGLIERVGENNNTFYILKARTI